MNNTEKYIEENKKVFSLKNKFVRNHTSTPKTIIGGSLFNTLKYHFKSCVRFILYFPLVLYQGKNFLKKTFSLKGTKKKNKALIIGNGPSQGYLSCSELDNFVKLGGETFGINSWHQNEELSKHVPTWMVFSDPLTFKTNEPGANEIINYIKKNSKIKIIVPSSDIKLIQSLGFKNEIFCFIDLELSIWKNINPLLPRGYTSSTIYKALAWSIYLDYNTIGVIGMDNTLPRNIYNDRDNRVHFYRHYAGKEDCLVDASKYHLNVASFYYDVFEIFYHLEYFPNKNVRNLDPFSLTDRFKKIDKEEFFKIKKN